MLKFKFVIEVEADNKEAAKMYLKNMLLNCKKVSMVELPTVDPEYEPVVPEGWSKFLICYKKTNWNGSVFVFELAEIWADSAERARESFMDDHEQLPSIEIIGIHQKSEDTKALFFIGLDKRNNATYMDEEFILWKDICTERNSEPCIFAVSSQGEIPEQGISEQITNTGSIRFYPKRFVFM